MSIEQLSLPTQAKEIEWRVQSTKNGKTILIPYITNRAIMNRLDDCVGPMYWKNEYEQWNDKGVKCGISVYNKEIKQWITKYDGADATNIQPTKGGFSDSMKRAGVQWGIGRDLYDYPLVRIDGEYKFIPFSVKEDLRLITEDVLSGNNKGFYLLSPNDKPNNTQNNATQQTTKQEKAKIDKWLSDQEFNEAKKLEPKKIANVLNKYNGKPYGDGKVYAMKTEYKKELQKLIQ